METKVWIVQLRAPNKTSDAVVFAPDETAVTRLVQRYTSNKVISISEVDPHHAKFERLLILGELHIPTNW